VQSLVEVKGLKKIFRVSRRREPGIWPTIKSIFKREFTDVLAVNGIDFNIPAGEIRALIGPNGAGKSTTIKVLCGILYPTEGDVRCLGVIPWENRLAYVRQIGAIFGQKTQLLWDLPALDTFALNRKIYKIPEAIFKQNIEYFTETFELASVLSKPVRNLSLGERMKCELTAALLHNPKLVFLDEPTIGLDILAKSAVRAFIKQVNKERGVTFLLTTHDLDDVENLCQRITVINHGVVIFDRTLEELRSGYVKKKILDLKFWQPVDDKELKGWNILEHKGISCSLSLDGEQKDYPAQIVSILAALPVQDVEIKNPDIESIIREMYLEPKNISSAT
jgi:ABC-2 type transport system ATP-binding protein